MSYGRRPICIGPRLLKRFDERIRAKLEQRRMPVRYRSTVLLGNEWKRGRTHRCDGMPRLLLGVGQGD
jgi:hypothetical protein